MRRIALKRRSSLSSTCILLLSFVAVGSSPSLAQTFLVTSDSAVFLDQINGAKVVGSMQPGSSFYAIQRKDGWVKAMEPKSETLGWMSRSHLQLVLNDQADAEADLILPRKKAFWAAAENGRFTADHLSQAKQWAADLQRIRGPLHPVSASANVDMGDLCVRVAAYDQAKIFYERGYQIRRNLYGAQSAEVAQSHLELARLAIETGDLVVAGKHAKSAAIINANLFGSDHPKTADARYEMGMALLSGSEYVASIAFFTKAFDSYQKQLGKSHVKATNAKGLVAYAYRESGYTDQAIDAYQENLAALTQQTPRPNQTIETTKLALAVLRVNPSERQTIDDAIESIKKYRGRYPSDDGVAESIEQRLVKALLASNTDQHRTAVVRVMDSSVRQLRKQLRKELWGIAPEKQADYLSYVGHDTFFQAISTAIDLKDDVLAAELSMQWLINAKGLVNEVQTAQAAGNDLQRRAAFANVPYVSIADVKSRLPANSAYVEILRYLDTDFSNGDRRSPQYAAWVVRKNGSPQIIDLGPGLLIDDGVVGTRRRIANAQANIRKLGEADAYKQLEASLRRTSDRIWKPIEAVIGDVDRVVICPDQGTWLLPWAAMLNSDGSFAIEKYQIQLEVTGRDLLRARYASRQPPVIYADPDYGDETQEPVQDDHIRMDVAERLPAFAEEAQTAKLGIGRLTGGPVTLLTHSQATEASFKRLQGPSVIMVSSHGFFLNADGQVMLAAEIQSDSGPSHQAAIAANPLLRCGLMLANCNGHISIDRMEDDGVLTGAEIAKVNLRGTHLAILSACETGVGSLEATGGVIGLQSAFHEAGAQCVIGSLWQVPDESTAALTKDFFRELANSRDVLGSLQSAQKAAIISRRSQHGVANPYFWAAFNVSGSTEF